MNRIDIFKKMLSKIGSNKSIDFSYSAVMRNLRKYQPNKVNLFMKNFKQSFEMANFEKLENPEKIALMEASQLSDLQLRFNK